MLKTDHTIRRSEADHSTSTTASIKKKKHEVLVTFEMCFGSVWLLLLKHQCAPDFNPWNHQEVYGVIL